MRNYCHFWYARFNERSEALDVDITIDGIFQSEIEIASWAAELQEEVNQANFDWTGSLTVTGHLWIQLNRRNVFQLLAHWIQTVNNPISTLQSEGIGVFYSPRSTWSHGK